MISIFASTLFLTNKYTFKSHCRLLNDRTFNEHRGYIVSSILLLYMNKSLILALTSDVAYNSECFLE